MAGARKRAPNHPGTLLSEVVLPAMRVSIAQAAREMGVSRQQLYKILAGERAITAEMAARLGKYCGNGPELWLNMQSAYDLWHAQHSLADELKNIPTRAAI
jgi:addiction module HigA family antidote